MAAMTLDTNYTSRRPSMAVTTSSLPTFSLNSPGLDHGSLRFSVDRVSPISIPTEEGNNTTLERTFSNTSIFYTSDQQQQQSRQQESWSDPGQQQPYKSGVSHQYQRSVSSAAASYSSYQTGETSGAPASAPTSPSAYSPSFVHTGGAETTGLSHTLDPQQSLEQMHVSLNVPVSLGGHSSLVHKHSHATHHNHSPYGQDGHLLQAQAQHWNSAGSMYQPEPSHYRTASSPPTADSPFTTRGVSIFSSAMAEDGGGVSGDLGGYGSSSDPRRQQQQQSHQHSHHSLPLLSQTHNGTPQLEALLNHTSSSNSADSAVMAYREHGSVSTSAASAYLPKMHAMSNVTSPPQYQSYQQADYQRQQSGTSTDATGRLFHSSSTPQAGLPGMTHSMGYAVGPGTGRSYPYQHQQSPGLVAGPVISNLGNPGSQMTLVPGIGMPYGASGHKPLLYSQGHHSMHPLSPGPIGHYSKGPISTNERPFRCDQCPQSFNRNHDLKRHKRIHLAVKPFPCNYCDKSFSRKDALKRHRLVKGCGEKLRSADMAGADDGMLHGSGGGASGPRH